MNSMDICHCLSLDTSTAIHVIILNNGLKSLTQPEVGIIIIIMIVICMYIARDKTYISLSHNANVVGVAPPSP